MRQLRTILVLLFLSGPLLAQQSAPQRGKFKSLDLESGLVTITTAEGVDVECTIVPQTMFRDGKGQPITDFKEKGLPAGTDVMFLSRNRDGKNILVGLKLPGQSGGNRPDVPPPPPPRESVGVKPLTELGDDNYKGETGGLYGNGSNEPPATQQNAAKLAAARIVPLDSEGKPSPDGKIGLLGIGMSNTTQEFSTFRNWRTPILIDRHTLLSLTSHKVAKRRSSGLILTATSANRSEYSVCEFAGCERFRRTSASRFVQTSDHGTGTLRRIPGSRKEAGKRSCRHTAIAQSEISETCRSRICRAESTRVTLQRRSTRNPTPMKVRSRSAGSLMPKLAAMRS